MADPTTITCTKSTWTPVAIDKKVGSISVQKILFFNPQVYYTWVDTGNDAPTIAPGETGNKAAAMESRYLPVNVSSGIDIYIWPAKRDTAVLVDLA